VPRPHLRRELRGGPTSPRCFPESRPGSWVVPRANTRLRTRSRGAPRHRGPDPPEPPHSPARWLLGSELSAIGLRHLLARSDTRGASSRSYQEVSGWSSIFVFIFIFMCMGVSGRTAAGQQPVSSPQQSFLSPRRRRWPPGCYGASFLCTDTHWPLGGATASLHCWTDTGEVQRPEPQNQNQVFTGGPEQDAQPVGEQTFRPFK